MGGLRGSTFAIMMDKMDAKISYFTDINPLKHNKFIPLISRKIGTKEYGKIESYDDIKQYLNKDSLIIILNSSYKDEIINLTKNKHRYICLS